MRSQRQLRVGEEIRHALAMVLQRGDVILPDGIIPDTVTVTEVQISPDLENATVFIVPLGGVKAAETAKALNSIVGFFRHEVAKLVRLRTTPKLRFKADESFSYAKKIEEILQKPEVAKDLVEDQES